MIIKKLRRIVTAAASGFTILLASAALAGAAEKPCDPTAGKLCNLLRPEFSSIPTFISGVLKVVVTLALPVIILFIVIAGFRFIMAQGSPSELTAAKKNLQWVLIGSLLVLGAWVLATLLVNTIAQLITT